MVRLIFAISDINMTPQSIRYPPIKTSFTNIHPLKIITTPQKLPMSGGLPTPIY